MLHIVKSANLIIKSTPLGYFLLLVSVLALLQISAQAQCANWDANAHMVLRQPGSKPTEIWLTQKGKLIQGTALAIVRKGGSNDGERRMTGTIDGTLDGDSFSVQIYWDNGQTGVYNGKVLLSGRLDGEAYEKRSPNVRLPWHTDEGLNCRPPPPVIPKPIKSSGKARPAPQPTPPFVVASQSIFPAPYVPTGFVTLTWDGGPDDPGAELWLKTSGGALTVAKHSKGGLQVTVERGRMYEYILTKAGKILVGVTFVAR
jgi:hypothetical protein